MKYGNDFRDRALESSMVTLAICFGVLLLGSVAMLITSVRASGGLEAWLQ